MADENIAVKQNLQGENTQTENKRTAAAQTAKIPRHVGIIMDGNGRWATARGKKRAYGHEAGAKNIETVVDCLFEKGVENVSLYAFSTENFSRTKDEVDELMSLLKKGLKKYGNYAVNKKVRLIVSGDMSLLNADLNREIAKEVQKTAKFSGRTLNICIAYGGRQEICRAAETLRKKGEPITVEALEKQLYTADLQPLDFIIRTGGEYRLSNFLLWQSAYAELYFTPVLWPDFNQEEVERALSAFSSRSRRFGKN